jgi:X-domain of DnaJ-containing
MVLNDQNVSIDVRKARAKALDCCGEIFQKAERSNQVPIAEQKELEQVAFHAMLDTVWRQEMNVRQHGHPGD